MSVERDIARRGVGNARLGDDGIRSGVMDAQCLFRQPGGLCTVQHILVLLDQ